MNLSIVIKLRQENGAPQRRFDTYRYKNDCHSHRKRLVVLTPYRVVKQPLYKHLGQLSPLSGIGLEQTHSILIWDHNADAIIPVYRYPSVQAHSHRTSSECRTVHVTIYPNGDVTLSRQRARA